MSNSSDGSDHQHPQELDRFFPPLSPEMEREAIRLARAQVEAGETVDAEIVLAWLATWGTPNETPKPV